MKKYCFWNVDTQRDFMLKGGKLYVPGAEDLLVGLARLMHFIDLNNLAVGGSFDWHGKDDPEFKVYPEHCVEETPGAELVFANVNYINYFGKVVPDIFSNKKAAKFIEDIAETYIVFGVATDICVAAAIEGMLKMGKKVILLFDLTAGIDDKKSAELMNGWMERGVKVRGLDSMMEMSIHKLTGEAE